MALHEFIVQSDEVGLRLDKFLATRLNTVSRSRLSLWIKSGFVFVDGQVKPSKHSIRESEVITVHEPDPTPIEIKPEEMALSIIYEDESLVVINKPPGLVVHPGAGHPDGTLVNGLMARYGALSNIGAPVRPGVVHRIDAGTSGLLVVARTDAAHLVSLSNLQNIPSTDVIWPWSGITGYLRVARWKPFMVVRQIIGSSFPVKLSRASVQ